MDLSLTPFGNCEKPIRLAISGAAPGELLQIKITSHDDHGHAFHAEVPFRADEQGELDTATTLPADASWYPANANGLAWVMTPEHPGTPWHVSDSTQVEYTISVRGSVSGGKGTTIRRGAALNVEEFHAELSDTTGAASVAGAPRTGHRGAFRGYRPLESRDREVPLVLLFPDASQAVAKLSLAQLAQHGYVAVDASPLARLDQQAMRAVVGALRKLPRVSKQEATLIGMGAGASHALNLAAAVDPEWIGPVICHSPWDFYPSDRPAAGDVSVVRVDAHTKYTGTALNLAGVLGPVIVSSGSLPSAWSDGHGREIRMADTLIQQCADLGIESISLEYDSVGAGVGYPFTLPTWPQSDLAISSQGVPIHLGGTAADRGKATTVSMEQTLSALTSFYG